MNRKIQVKNAEIFCFSFFHVFFRFASHPPELGSKGWMSDPEAFHRERRSLRAREQTGPAGFPFSVFQLPTKSKKKSQKATKSTPILLESSYDLLAMKPFLAKTIQFVSFNQSFHHSTLSRNRSILLELS